MFTALLTIGFLALPVIASIGAIVVSVRQAIDDAKWGSACRMSDFRLLELDASRD